MGAACTSLSGGTDGAVAAGVSTADDQLQFDQLLGDLLEYRIQNALRNNSGNGNSNATCSPSPPTKPNGNGVESSRYADGGRAVFLPPHAPADEGDNVNAVATKTASSSSRPQLPLQSSPHSPHNLRRTASNAGVLASQAQQRGRQQLLSRLIAELEEKVGRALEKANRAAEAAAQQQQLTFQKMY